MSGAFTLKVEGLKELQAQLVDLGAATGIKALAQAARKAFKPVLESAQALVPVDSGELRDSLKLSVKKPSGTGETVVVVGIKIGATRGGSKQRMPPARRWHFVEFGTAHMAAHPFFRPALDQNVTQLLEAVKTELVKSIRRAIKRQSKGA